MSCSGQTVQAPARRPRAVHHDHIKSWAAGGTTSTVNGQGLCAACNQDKEARGWTAEPADPRPRDTPPGTALPHTTTTTPTGHRYGAVAPPLPGPTREKHAGGW